MKFILANVSIKNNTILENYFDQEVLKELPFNSKTILKLPGGKKNVSYDLVFFPMVDANENRTQEDVLLEEKLNSKLSYGNNYNFDVLFSITNAFKTKTRMDLDKATFSIDVISVVDSNYDITYTDGSFKKETNEASYGVVKILEEDNQNGLLEEFTNKKYNHSQISGKVVNGSNNIGELAALKIAIENFSESKYQIIISDSEYSVKCFREWYYTWKNNGFRNYAKKSISNKNLIIEIADKIKTSNKIVVFKWVKGHSKMTFNEICDELAKDALK
jgi:ribonuclease HI